MISLRVSPLLLGMTTASSSTSYLRWGYTPHYWASLSKLFTREGGAGADGAILLYVGHLQLISTLKIGADCCRLCQYKLTKPNLT